ncbi:cation transporter [Oleiagrimonas sp.]|jgi:copper chaperone|uniref:CopZ family metallochaperone n=1 Tax=Oleiagrimonas sp. TaxID=2010330 RepID=UPI002631DB4B|nr:cation transporter [Oleiagrimonas sp.]MDA3914141.1 cation transporter [Oleiagrimonas sp.]
MTTLKITGMTCGHCVKAVQQALSDVPGVTRAEVDLQARQAQVEGSADVDALIAAVQEEGYEARAA